MCDLLTDSKTLVDTCYDSVERKITNWKVKNHIILKSIELSQRCIIISKCSI